MEREAYEELHVLEGNHWWYQGMRQITERILSPVLQGQQHLILDAGCGVGGNLHALSRYGQVIGFDYSPIALGYAHEKHSGKISRATVEALPYSDNTFDLVTSFDVLYCREVEDDVRALNEFARVTKPNGYVLVRLPALPALRGTHDVVVHGARRYTAQELRDKMLCVNLTPIRITYANSILLPPIFVLRKLQTSGLLSDSNPQSNASSTANSTIKSDVKPTPAPINRLLTSLLSLEAQWIGSGRSFPAGVSVFALARKSLQKPQ